MDPPILYKVDFWNMAIDFQQGTTPLKVTLHVAEICYAFGFLS